MATTNATDAGYAPAAGTAPAVDQLDSRVLRPTDCYGQRFMRPGEYHYALAPAGAGDAVGDLPFVVQAVETAGPGESGKGTTKAKTAAATKADGIGQTTVTVRTDGRRFVPDREVVTVQVGDMVLWHGLDGARPFVVRGEKEFFASDHLLNESGYTHVFSAPGRHAWADAHGSDLHGVVDVALPALGTAKDVAAWQARIAVGTVVTIADGVAEPAAVKVVVGQTVFFVVTKTGTGISITDTALLAGAAPDAPQPGRGSSSARRTAA